MSQASDKVIFVMVALDNFVGFVGTVNGLKFRTPYSIFLCLNFEYCAFFFFLHKLLGGLANSVDL